MSFEIQLGGGHRLILPADSGTHEFGNVAAARRFLALLSVPGALPRLIAARQKNFVKWVPFAAALAARAKLREKYALPENEDPEESLRAAVWCAPIGQEKKAA